MNWLTSSTRFRRLWRVNLQEKGEVSVHTQGILPPHSRCVPRSYFVNHEMKVRRMSFCEKAIRPMIA